MRCPTYREIKRVWLDLNVKFPWIRPLTNGCILFLAIIGLISLLGSNDTRFERIYDQSTDEIVSRYNALYAECSNQKNRPSPSSGLIVSPLFKMFGGGQMLDDQAAFVKPAHIEYIGGPDHPFEINIDFVGKTGNKPKVLVDIGVFDGHEAAMAVNKGFTVFGFEPINGHINWIHHRFQREGVFDRLRFINMTDLLINDFDDDIHKLQQALTPDYVLEQFPPQLNDEGKGFCYLFQAATSNDFAKIQMADRGSGSDMSNVSPGSNKGNVEGKEVSTVVTLPVSVLVRHDVFWFKTDTQGHELAVLQGAEELFQNHNVYAVTLEFWPSALIQHNGDDGVRKLMDLLERLGFRTCFQSNTQEFGLLFDRSVGVEEFVEMALSVKDVVHFHQLTWFDDLTCI